MCVKLPPGDLNPTPTPHTPQVLILVEWPLHQGCVVLEVNELHVFSYEKKNCNGWKKHFQT